MTTKNINGVECVLIRQDYMLNRNRRHHHMPICGMCPLSNEFALHHYQVTNTDIRNRSLCDSSCGSNTVWVPVAKAVVLMIEQ